MTYADGETRDFNHSWCVTAAAAVIDPTMPRKPEPGAVIAYREGFKDGLAVPWPDEFLALEARIKAAAAAMTDDAKRWEIERYGQVWKRNHEKELGRAYRPPWDRRYARVLLAGRGEYVMA